MRVLLAGGGTAGHTSPLLATADALRRLEPEVEITCLGTARGLETRVVPEAGYALELIPPVPLPRKPNVDLLKVPARLRGAVRDTVRVLDRTGADVVVGFGGYVSMPAYLAARRRKVPIVLHEQNAMPGLANKAGARIARRVAVSFPDTPLPKAEYVGLPLRAMIARLDRDAMRAEARRFFDLDPDRPTLLVTGGSQGARRLNQAVSGASAALAGAGVQVLHVVGPKGEASPERERRAVRRRVRSSTGWTWPTPPPTWCSRAAAPTASSRPPRSGCPAIFVPLPIGNGEQVHNARPVVDAGGALLVNDAELTSAWVASHVPTLATDPVRLAAMGAAASGLVPRDADERLARIVLEVGGDEGARPRRAAARRGARPGALRRHRRRGPLGHRADHGRRAASPSPAATTTTRRSCPGCASSACRATSATPPSTSATPTRSSSRPPRARTTPRCSRAGAAGCGSCPVPPGCGR